MREEEGSMIPEETKRKLPSCRPLVETQQADGTLLTYKLGKMQNTTSFTSTPPTSHQEDKMLDIIKKKMEDDECPTSTRIKLVRKNIIFLEEKLKLMKDPINLISLDQIDKYWSLAHTSVDSLMDIIFSRSYYEERDYLDYLRDSLNEVIKQMLGIKQQLRKPTALNSSSSWPYIQHYPPTWFQGTGNKQMIQTRPRGNSHIETRYLH